MHYDMILEWFDKTYIKFNSFFNAVSDFFKFFERNSAYSLNQIQNN